jgi:hypothetical protein
MLRKKEARKLLEIEIADAIRCRLDEFAGLATLSEEAKLRLTGWMSQRLYRLAARAAVTAFEAALEGERLRESEGDAKP